MRVDPALEHGWDVGDEVARAIQRDLATRVRVVPFDAEGTASASLAAGADVGYSRDGARAWAAVVVMDRAYRVLEEVVVEGSPDRSYAPGFLAFREGRLTLEALGRLAIEPDVVFLDGHGVVHERGLGLASHVGVLLDVPTIGVPKTPFHAVERLPEPSRGSVLVYTKEWGAQGAAVRLRTGVKPVYVSPGHRVDLESAIAICIAWSTGRHKVPEPLQAADTLSRLARNRGRE
jgi:deoxyribonuclease V